MNFIKDEDNFGRILIIAVKYNNLNYFAFTLLFKSLLLFCLKINYIKKDIINLKT